VSDPGLSHTVVLVVVVVEGVGTISAVPSNVQSLILCVVEVVVVVLGGNKVVEVVEVVDVVVGFGISVPAIKSKSAQQSFIPE